MHNRLYDSKKKTHSVLMERDSVFSTITYSADAAITRVHSKSHWTKDILSSAQVMSEWIDGERRSGLAEVSIGEAGGREIQ